jgi:hypothetical protein
MSVKHTIAEPLIHSFKISCKIQPLFIQIPKIFPFNYTIKVISLRIVLS